MEIFLLLISITLLKADVSFDDINWLSKTADKFYDGFGHNYFSYPKECTQLLEDFAQFSSDLSFCSIQYSRPIRLCEKCVNQYVKFHDKYQELKSKVVNGTSCGSLFMSHDRLNVVMDYHDSISAVWNKGNCITCYDWNNSTPTLKNDTLNFYNKYNDTMDCILQNYNPKHENNVCDICLDKYVDLDNFYKSLSSDSIGVDSICMDIVDSMNTTRSIWSKNLNCCNLRRTPQIAFLCCASIMSILPIFYYLAVRFCGPIRDLPNVLKQSRFKQTILSSSQVKLRSSHAINE